MENIDKLILDIADCEKKLEELEKANNRREIVDLLNEYSVENVEIEKIELPDEKQVYEEVEKSIPKKPSNMVVRIKEPLKINVKSVSDTAKLVMKKVVIVLEPKKFNTKRDKLKEAELELKKEKLEVIENNDIVENTKVIENKIEEVKENIDTNVDNKEKYFR